jgi:glycerophosphoryl diester phosphodiesterase
MACLSQYRVIKFTKKFYVNSLLYILMLRHFIAIIFIPLIVVSQPDMSKKIEIHGHRGFRGCFPENTLTGFKEAVKAGVDAIELDVVVSKDLQVVVSHEPWFNYKTCTEPGGGRITLRNQHNLYKMDYAEIRQYDCGIRGNSEFPEQIKMPEYKPLLSETISEIEIFCKENNLPRVKYNIEIKSGKAGDKFWHPLPEKIASLVVDVIREFDINERIMIQSFDTRSLQAMHHLDPSIKLGLLIANTGSVDHNLRKLGFIPYMYNPSVKLTKEKTVKQANLHGCKIMVWTVNSANDMKRLVDYGVDGLITDFPPIALKLTH